MADVYAIFGTLLALGIAFPGMLTAWWLLFPGFVSRAQGCFERSPWRCLGMGVVIAIPALIIVMVFSALPFGPAKFSGAMIAIAALGLASLGATGVAAVLGDRLAERSGTGLSPFAGFLRGALALELAAAFPIIGWLLAIPAFTLASLGAAGSAVVRKAAS